jgi:hypothetical protein
MTNNYLEFKDRLRAKLLSLDRFLLSSSGVTRLTPQVECEITILIICTKCRIREKAFVQRNEGSRVWKWIYRDCIECSRDAIVTTRGG